MKKIVLFLFVLSSGVTYPMTTRITTVEKLYNDYVAQPWQERNERLARQAQIKAAWFNFDKDTPVDDIRQFIRDHEAEFGSQEELVNAVDQDGDTLLHNIQFELQDADPKEENPELVQMMKDEGFDVSKKNSKSLTYDQQEVYCEWFEHEDVTLKTLEEFVDKHSHHFGSDRDLINLTCEGKTLLQLLQDGFDEETIRWLKSKGADYNSIAWKRHDLWTRRAERTKALEKWFAFTKDTPVNEVKTFITDQKKWFAKRGDLINAVKEGNTLIHKLVSTGINENHDLYKLLSEDVGFDKEARNSDGKTVEQALALMKWFALAKLETQNAVVDVFLAAHENLFNEKKDLVNATNRKGDTFLHCLALNGADQTHELFAHLVDHHEACSGAENSDGESALKMIARRKWFAINVHTTPQSLQRFITLNHRLFNGRNHLVNCVDSKGNTLLHDLVLRGCDEADPLYICLVNEGAQVSLRNRNGASVEDLVVSFRWIKMITAWNRLPLQGTKAEIDAFIVQHNQVLPNVSRVINYKDENGDTIFHRLARKGHTGTSDVVKHLCETSDCADLTIKNKKDETFDDVIDWFAQQPRGPSAAVKKPKSFITGKKVTLALLLAIILYIAYKKLEESKMNKKTFSPEDRIDVASIIDDLSLDKLE